MDENLENDMQESLSEWATIEKTISERQKKDRIIISKYCATHKDVDIINILNLFDKYNGLPSHDDEIIKDFKSKYPKDLTVKSIKAFEDVKIIYSDFLESGGE